LTPAQKPGELTSFLVPPPVFSRSRPDLGDLRLVDSKGHSVQYALRIKSDKNEQRILPGKLFDHGFQAASKRAEVSLDLGEKPVEYNLIRVNTSGGDFRRALTVESSPDGKTWATLLDGLWLITYRTESGTVDRRNFSCPTSRARYLRFRAERDTSQPTDAPTFDSVDVMYTVKVPGEFVSQRAQVGIREPVPTSSGPGSAWFLDLREQVPVSQLKLDVSDRAFVRSWTLEVSNPGEGSRFLASGEWRRQAGEFKPLEISFGETQARRFRLTVTDYRNPPLSLTGAEYTAAAREVVFRSPPPSPSPDETGLRLFTGNAQAGPPHYVFADFLPAKLEPAPGRVEVSALSTNPVYRPTPKPWTERNPWLVDLVLCLAGAVLLGILGGLGLTAIRRSDAAPRP
jgi:hypothetical protein